jgi:hypothetical protein
VNNPIQSRRATVIAAANVLTRPAWVDSVVGLGSELLFAEPLALVVSLLLVALPFVELPNVAKPDEELSVELFASLARTVWCWSTEAVTGLVLSPITWPSGLVSSRS